MRMTEAQVASYRREGFLIVPNLIRPDLLSALTKEVHAELVARGDRYLPAVEDRHRMDGYIDHEVRLASVGPQNKYQGPEVVVKKEKPLRLFYRNQKEMDRVYDAIQKFKTKYREYKPLPEGIKGEKELLNSFDQSLGMKMTDDFNKSGKLLSDIKKSCFFEEALRYLQTSGKTWCRLLQTSSSLRDAYLSKPSGIGEAVGDAAAQLAGVLAIRIFDLSVQERTRFCNATPIFFDGFGDLSDLRALECSIVLPGQQSPLNADHGGLVVFPTSHLKVSKITNRGLDTSMFKPPTFDLAECIRSHKELLDIEPVVLPQLEPGTGIFLNALSLRCYLPNMCANAELLQEAVDDTYAEPLLLSANLIPDGAVYNGRRETWMSKDKNGPLVNFQKGQPFADAHEFPILHSLLED